MNYALAKELKDAGFPQKEPNGFVGVMNAGQGDEHGRAYFPSLEELIEACGSGFNGLWRSSKGDWYTVNELPLSEYPKQNYPTPTEAVARLWLALNKK